tara:strand:- start:1 stop:762 length:762 start_codon:yes stop_codon:yes gene_type:complete
MKKHQRHSTILIGKNTVTKTAAPELMRIEVKKTQRAYDIGLDYGLFRVPKVLDYDEVRGVVVLERINEVHPFSTKTNHCRSVIEQIGHSLAIIHQTLSLPQTMVNPLPTELFLPEEEVFLHGDFNGQNICVDPSSNAITIFDWQMTHRHGGKATYGSRYFDLVWFVNYLLWEPTIGHLLGDPVAPVAKSFLTSYFRNADISYNADALASYANSFFAMKLPMRKQNATWRTRYLLQRSGVLTQRFIASLEALTS